MKNLFLMLGLFLGLTMFSVSCANEANEGATTEQSADTSKCCHGDSTKCHKDGKCCKGDSSKCHKGGKCTNKCGEDHTQMEGDSTAKCGEGPASEKCGH